MSYQYYLGRDSTDHLFHYGVGHDRGGRSGRYPWGSGKSPRGKRSSGTSDGNSDGKKRTSTKNQKTAIKVGAAVAGAALASYGIYQLQKHPELVSAGRNAVETLGARAMSSTAKGLDKIGKRVSRIGEKRPKNILSKDEALKRGTAEDILRYKDELDPKEIEKAIARLRNEETLKGFTYRSKAFGEDKAKRIIDQIGDKIVVPMTVGATAYAIKELVENLLDDDDNTKTEEERRRKRHNELKTELFKNVNPRPKK